MSVETDCSRDPVRVIVSVCIVFVFGGRRNKVKPSAIVPGKGVAQGKKGKAVSVVDRDGEWQKVSRVCGVCFSLRSFSFLVKHKSSQTDLHDWWTGSAPVATNLGPVNVGQCFRVDVTMRLSLVFRTEPAEVSGL